MSGDGTDRGGSGLPDDSADGTDWLLSQLDADDTEAIETQPDDAQAERPSAPPVVPDPVPAETPAPESAPAPAWTPAPESAPAPAWTPVSESTPVAEPTPAPQSTPAPEAASAESGALRHPNALELPVVPPTPAPAAPVPPARNELTVDTDSVLQHAPAGTFRPAPTNPVVLPPVDDEPWSLGASDDDARPAPEDVSTMALPTARALAADDPEAWAAVDAEHAPPTTDTPARPSGFVTAPDAEPAAPQPADPAQPADAPQSVDAPQPPAATFGAQRVEPAFPPADADSDDDLPEGSWSLSETFGDDVLGGETVEVRDRATDTVTTDSTVPADARTATDAAPDHASTSDDATTSAPRTDPLAWLTEPFGETFGANQTSPAAQPSDAADPVDTDAAPESADAADPIAAQPWPLEAESRADVASTDPASEPVDVVDDSLAAQPAPIEPETVTEPTPDAAASSAPVTPAAPFRWDTVVASPTPAAPSAPAEVPWPETVPDASAEPLDETRPFDSLGGPGFSALGGAAAEQPFPVDPEPVTAERSAGTDAPVDDAATETSEVPPAFGPPTPQAERSITELISLDGVQPEPTVSPFGSAPFVWDLAPNDALDPLVHAAPTTQPIPVPAVQWEGTDTPAVSAESPSELALEGEVPDAAFIAGDVQPFAPGLAAETLGRPLVDGPGDEFASWRDDAIDDADSDTPAVVPAANDTVDLFPTLSLGGLDASLDAAAAAGGLGVLGSAAPVLGADLDERAPGDTEDAAASVDAPASPTDDARPAEPAGFAVDPEELDDEFDEEIVQFDAVPLSAAAATPLPSFSPDAPDAEAADADADTPDATEPEPVSEELRLESLFDVGPDTDTVEVPVSDGEPSDTEPTDGPASATPTTPSDSLADAFAAEGGWSLQTDAVADAEPAPADATVPGAEDATDPDERSADDASSGSDAPTAGEHAAGPAPAYGAALGAHAAAVPSQGPATHPVQTAPAALPGETVAFPELDGSNGFVTPAAAAGIVGASLPPQPTSAPSPTQQSATPTSVPDRDLPEYRGEALDQSIPKALLWVVVGLGAAVLLLLAFYFGTLVGAANAAGAAGAAGVTPQPTVSSFSSDTSEEGSA
ncbi:hypothetical protein ITJ57_04570 [Plantibacter sp. VKM Ac-2880]|uniref:hypothetical protein n=1 Tax=Plantibacter sp. VKM Ac-2880 TaxID=2783827 RepID=UPI00188E6FD7|nr:hypothetical protein [Plantibacter sp. VKM Ac-2880]MBF4568037.1 hypothetical protein [Plantibacter sp. VKM Ac-2880]